MLILNDRSKLNPLTKPALRAVLGALFAITLSTQSWGQLSSMGSAFTYQGELKLTGEPVNDTADFEFTLWDDLEGGAQIGSLVPVSEVPVEEGLFNVELDFGVMAFNGDARWLEVAVRSPAGEGEFTTLSPRQALTAAPYALQTRGIFVDDEGNVGIGTTAPQHLLSVGDNTADSQMIGIRSYGNTGSNWKGGAAFGYDSAAVVVGELSDVATLGAHNANLSAWADLAINPSGDVFISQDSGNVGIGTTTPASKLHVEGDLTVSGQGKGNVIAKYLKAEYVFLADNAVRAGQSIYDDGFLETRGPGSYRNVTLTSFPSYPDHGEILVCDAAGGGQAGAYVDYLGQGVVWGDWKFFRADNPFDPETEIWYGCLEGPEQAAYNRGTAQLFNGSAYIEFPDHFRAVAVAEGMSVQLTPKSAQSLGLAVVEADLDGVVVQELHNGSGNYEFYFTVTAARRGSERFDVVRPKGDRVTGPMPRDRRTNR